MPSSRRSTTVIWLITLGGLVLRLYRFVETGPRVGTVAYDDGVYFGAAVRLVHGSLPYRDFVFVHPPVITELLAPLAALSPHVSTVPLVFAGRVLTALVGAATIPLIGQLLRHRGLVAVAVGCGLFAIHDDAVAATRGTLIEPYLAFFVVLGLVLFFSGDALAAERRVFWAGVVFGVAVATKIWAVVPVLVLVALCLRDRGRLTRLVGGIAVGALVPCLPFVVAAPGAFFHDVVVAQLTRNLPRHSLGDRVSHLLGLHGLGSARAAVMICVALALVALLGFGYRAMWRSRRPVPLEIAVLAGTVVTGLMFLLPSEFYWHYAAFFAPFLALTAALPAGYLAARARERPVTAWYALGSAVLAACLVSTALTLGDHFWQRPPAAAVGRALPAGTCTLTNDPSLALAVNRMPTGSDCPVIVDPVGTAFVKAGGKQGRRAQSAPAQRRLWVHAIRASDALLLSRAWLRLVPMQVLRPVLRRQFRLVPTPDRGVLLYVRSRPRK